MNYVQCRNKVAGLLNNRKATDAQIAAWMQSALQRIQRELRAPLQEKIVEVTINNNTTTPFTGLVIPADMLEMIDLLNQEGIRMPKADISAVIRESRGVPGVSKHYYRAGGKYLLAPIPNDQDIITLIYYAEFGPLVLDTDSNILTEVADDALVFATLVFAGTNFSDTRKGDWESEYQKIMGDLQGQSDTDELSGAAVVSPAWQWPDDTPGYGGQSSYPYGNGYW